MKMIPHLRPLLLACLAAFSTIQAQQPAGTQAEPTPEQQADLVKKIEERKKLVDSFGWSTEGNGKLGPHAEIVIPKGWRFTGPDGTRKLMQLYENPPTDIEMGMLAQAEGIGSPPWIIFEFRDTGYVKDDEKDSLDADALLESLQEGQKEGNKFRRDQGLNELEVIGWAIPPRYNTQTNNLEWATKIRTIGAPPDAYNINFNTRLLGRRGVMEVTLVCDPEELSDMIAEQAKILTGYSYIQGERYAEYQSGDKIAEYGLTALVAGGGAYALAKSGLLGKLSLMFAKLGKAAILLVVGVFVAIKKLFSKLFGFRQSE